MSNVVVVDDDPTNTTLIKMLLELEGFNVTTCADLARAREAAKADTDAFLVDYHLARGVSGIELVNEVRNGATPSARDSVIIVTSGDVRRERDAKEAGADLFLLKPYKPNTLSDTLKEMLAAKGAHD
jgi:CheY-like chemotaxis protein